MQFQQTITGTVNQVAGDPEKFHLRFVRWRTVAILIAGVAAILVTAMLLRPAEPTYHGRTLDSWLGDFRSDKPSAQLLATGAVRQMGTNAIPFLVKRLRQADPKHELRLRRLLRELGTTQSPVKFSVPYPRLPREEALEALDTLGASATNAIPALEQLLHEQPPDYRALLVLAKMGPAGAAVLASASTNGDRLIRDHAQICLHLLQTHSEILFPQQPQAYEFQRKQCQINLLMIQSAFTRYKKLHPEAHLPDDVYSTPPSSPAPAP